MTEDGGHGNMKLTGELEKKRQILAITRESIDLCPRLFVFAHSKVLSRC